MDSHYRSEGFCLLSKHWFEVTEVCVWSELEMHIGSQRAQNSLCDSRHTYTNDYSRLGSGLPDPEKQSTHGASVLFHMLIGEWTLMQPSRLQKRKNDNLSIHNTVTLKMSLHYIAN